MKVKGSHPESTIKSQGGMLNGQGPAGFRMPPNIIIQTTIATDADLHQPLQLSESQRLHKDLFTSESLCPHGNSMTEELIPDTKYFISL